MVRFLGKDQGVNEDKCIISNKIVGGVYLERA